MVASKRIPIPISDSQTTMAGLGSVCGCNCRQDYTVTNRLILQESPKLVERPSVKLGTLALSDPGVIANARQIFYGDSQTMVTSKPNDSSTHRMVDPSHVTLLSAGQPFQKAFRPFCALPLERGSQSLVMVAKGLDVGSSKSFAGREGSQVLYSEIYTQDTCRLCMHGRFGLECDLNKVGPILTLNECRARWTSTGKQVALTGADHELETHSAPQQGQGYGAVLFSQAKNTLVIICTGRVKDAVPALRLESPRHAVDCSNRKITRESILCPDFPVHHMVKLNLVSGTGRFRHLPDRVARLRKSNKRRIDSRSQVNRHVNLATQCQYLSHGIEHTALARPYQTNVRASSIFKILVGACPRLMQGIRAGWEDGK